MALSLPQIIQLVCFSIMLACGQTLFKFSALSTPSLTSVTAMLGLATNIWFWIAVTLYALSTVLWVYILQQVPLSIAYPFVALGFILVPTIGWFIFKEPINIYYIIGSLMILGGVGLITALGSK